MPLKVECHTVPHLKALTRGIHWSTEGRRSTAVAESFLPLATATAAEGQQGRRPNFRPKAKNLEKWAKRNEKLG